MFQYLLVRLKDGRIIYYYRVNQFQYLLVRLKDGRGGCQPRGDTQFQYLLVRLKELGGFTSTELSSHFNTSWYD